MPSYAVKHLIADHGPLSKVMKEIRKTPYSYTSKEPEATDASRGSDIYVFEVHVQGSTRMYALGYRYRATEKFSLAGGLWKNEFKFKNSATPGTAVVGYYFDIPLILPNGIVHSWLAGKQPGMAEMPENVILEVERLAATPSSGARFF